MRIVVLTSLPRPVLLPDGFLPLELRRQGIPVTAIVARRVSLGRVLRLHSGARPSRLARSAAAALWRRLRGARGEGQRTDAPIPIHYVQDHNSAGAVAILRAFSPDLLVLGGTGIIGRQVLEIPRLGTLGCHYGLLPGLRGVNVTEWAVLLDEPVGVSTFWVDGGVDTGDVVLRRQIEVRPGDTLGALRRRSAEVGKELYVESIRGIIDGTAPRIPQEPAAGPQYFRMHPRLLRLVERKLREGRYTPAPSPEPSHA